MDSSQKLLDFINEKTCNRFNFLKIKQVFFVEQTNTFCVCFVSPETNEVEENERIEIKDIIKEYIKIDCNVEATFSKSYIEKDIILHRIKDYLEKSNPSFYNSISIEDIEIEKEDVVKVIFNLDKLLLEFFIKNNMANNLKLFLEKNFCTSFEVLYKEKEEDAANEDFLNIRFKEVKRQSEIESFNKQNEDKYIVTNKKVLIGKEITFRPRYISSIKKPMENCVVAGKILFINEKTFTPKRAKQKENEESNVKPYFTFQIKDETGSLHAVIFPSKTNYHKMNLLKQEDSIIVSGRVNTFNGNFEIMVKDISFCEIADKNKIEKIEDQNLILDYTYVRPQNYFSEKQSGIFDKEKIYSKEIMMGSFVVYDFETTGIDFERDEIIEIGALKIVNGEYKEVFSTLVKPKRPIPQEATKVNRITNDMVKNKYSIEQVIRDFYLFCKGCQMVGYNSINFDSQFLYKAARSVNINFDNNQIDAFLLAKQKLKGLKNYKLGTVSTFLEVNLIDAHRALNDVLATAEVFLKLY